MDRGNDILVGRGIDILLRSFGKTIDGSWEALPGIKFNGNWDWESGMGIRNWEWESGGWIRN